MAFSLYTAIVPSYLQMLDALLGLLRKADSFCIEKALPPEVLLRARLAEDMEPFAYQVKSTVVHSLGAIEGVRRGEFSPDTTSPPATFAALTERINQARATLREVSPAEVDGFVGRDMRFVRGERYLDYFAEDFLLSFSHPNFYFHANTAYAILRWQGLSIGKRDFTGKTRIRHLAGRPLESPS